MKDIKSNEVNHYKIVKLSESFNKKNGDNYKVNDRIEVIKIEEEERYANVKKYKHFFNNQESIKVMEKGFTIHIIPLVNDIASVRLFYNDNNSSAIDGIELEFIKHIKVLTRI